MAKQPKIRFKGFTEEWKEKGFSELVTIRRGLTYSPESIVSEDGIVVLRSSNISDGQFRTYKDDVRVRNEVVHIPLVEDGDILITAANGSKDLVGKHAVIHNLQEPSVPGGFMLLASGKETTFVNALMGSSWYSHFIGLSTCGGGGSIGNLNKSDLESQIVYIPNDKAERDIIAKYFDSLDSTITSREAELEKLKNIKRALLEKLFPQDGQSTPAIRFKGFNEKWCDGQIGDAFTERDERSGDGELLSVTINSGIRRAKEMERTFTTGDLNKYKVVRKGDIAYNTMRMWQGACGVSEYSGIVSPAYTIAMPREGHVSAFYAYYFKSNRMLHDFRIYSQGLTSDTWNLKYPSFAKIKAFYPKNTEQRKIADTMLNLDCVISLRERQLTLLKHSKQALLEQMFVNE